MISPLAIDVTALKPGDYVLISARVIGPSQTNRAIAVEVPMGTFEVMDADVAAIMPQSHALRAARSPRLRSV